MRVMKIKYLIICLLIGIAANAQSGDLSKSITTPDYSIIYSPKWKLDETKRSGAEFFLLYSPEPGKFGANINLLIQNFPGQNFNLDSYTEISIAQIKAAGTLLNSKRKSANDTEFQELIFTANYNGFDVKFLQYYFFQKDQAYVVTFTALETEFDSLLPEAVKVMESFSIAI